MGEEKMKVRGKVEVDEKENVTEKKHENEKQGGITPQKRRESKFLRESKHSISNKS